MKKSQDIELAKQGILRALLAQLTMYAAKRATRETLSYSDVTVEMVKNMIHPSFYKYEPPEYKPKIEHPIHSVNPYKCEISTIKNALKELVELGYIRENPRKRAYHITSSGSQWLRGKDHTITEPDTALKGTNTFDQNQPKNPIVQAKIAIVKAILEAPGFSGPKVLFFSKEELIAAAKDCAFEKDIPDKAWPLAIQNLIDNHMLKKEEGNLKQNIYLSMECQNAMEIEGYFSINSPEEGINMLQKAEERVNKEINGSIASFNKMREMSSIMRGEKQQAFVPITPVPKLAATAQSVRDGLSVEEIESIVRTDLVPGSAGYNSLMEKIRTAFTTKQTRTPGEGS